LTPGILRPALATLMPSPARTGLPFTRKDAGVGAEDQVTPGAGELVQIQGRAVEEVQEPVVAGGLQSQGAYDAGDPQQILAGSHSRQTERHPQEGSGPGAGGP
jgi:hypothetical protein